MSQANVLRVQGIISQDRWDDMFPLALPVYTYDNFLRAVSKFPKFCNESQDGTSNSALE